MQTNKEKCFKHHKKKKKNQKNPPYLLEKAKVIE